MLYNTRKGNSYFLFEIGSGSDEDHWIIHTNSNKIRRSEKEKKFLVHSTSKKCNDKYKISRCLSHVMKNLYCFPERIKKKYYNRIRTLITTTYKATKDRLEKKMQSERNTKTFIKFSYKHTTVYFGIFWRCDHCENPVAHVFNRNRRGCHAHEHLVRKKPTRQRINKKTIKKYHLDLNEGTLKGIQSNRLGISYAKEVIRKDNESYRTVTLKNLMRPSLSFDMKNLGKLKAVEIRQYRRLARQLQNKKGFLLDRVGEIKEKTCLHQNFNGYSERAYRKIQKMKTRVVWEEDSSDD
jgi:hypothetical protein